MRPPRLTDDRVDRILRDLFRDFFTVGATEADVTATYKDGVLEIRVPTEHS